MPRLPCLSPARLAGRLAALALSLPLLVLLGCASAPPPPDLAPVRPLLRDEAFDAPAVPVRAEEVLALDEEMRRYLDYDIARHLRSAGRQYGLMLAMRDRNLLRLEYDGGHTRTAREAFQARSGNCLSLVILTAALAHHLNLPVTFQSVEVDDSYSRAHGLLFAAGHVNLVIGQGLLEPGRNAGTDYRMTVDFLAPQDLRNRHVTPIDERRVLAMFFNNRAAETLSAGEVHQAYAYAREAVLQDPSFASAIITLGVVLQRRGLLDAAEAAYRHALALQPRNTHALADLASALAEQGRSAEAAEVKQALARLEDFPPFHFFELGRAAVRRGDTEAGIAFLKRELARDPDYHEVHFWLAQAYYAQRDLRATRRHLGLAVANSTSRGDHDLYAAKLDHLNADGKRRQ